MKRILFVTVILLTLLSRFAYAGEGMWIPALLKQLNEKEMKAMGMNISADDIYSINHSSMKDAILLFGSGCTSEIISKEGLLLTNHHCGYSFIQRHSSVEHDYLTNGFWAMSKEEELPNPGLTATMMIRMEDVTKRVLEGVSENMTEKERRSIIKKNSEKIVKETVKDTPYEAKIKAFFKGNTYYIIVTQTFKDIRLVGTPPSNIGKFGGDTDNWMWPRHTGDFSLFRIYVGRDGKPAEYSEDNVPYQPKYYFPISLKGVNEGDFTFVYGYPARTNEYLPAKAVELITEKENPEKIKLREARINIFKKYAEQSPELRIKYAAKEARVANYWKKMIGQSRGIKRFDGIEKKREFEKRFTQWVNGDNERKNKYGNLLPALNKTYEKLEPYQKSYDYLYEAGFGIEMVTFAYRFEKLVKMCEEGKTKDNEIQKAVESLKKSTKSFYKDYYRPVDIEVMTKMLEYWDKGIEFPYKPGFFNTIHKKFNSDYAAYTGYVFKKSFLDDNEKVNSFLDDFTCKKIKKLKNDPFYKIEHQIYTMYKSVKSNNIEPINMQIDSLMRLYMKAQMEMQPGKRFYPDANFTLRVTYGNVKGFSPADAVEYLPYTTLKGIMEKENPEIYDYVVEPRLKELYEKKDYGQYADKDGSLHVCFIADNHTSGGNSGSPVFDADGNLTGVNFDRCWEGTMSDLMFDPKVCRNISLDIRYFLFILDKYAGAGYLLDEMKLVK